MALITCEECGKEISSTAECCPHCGHKTAFSKENAKKKDLTIALYICLAAIGIGLFLLIPALITLLENYNDWYFWNWHTEQSASVVKNISLGIALTGAGIGAMLGLRARVKRDTQAETETNAQESDSIQENG